MLSEGVTNEMLKAGIDLHTYTTVSEIQISTFTYKHQFLYHISFQLETTPDLTITSPMGLIINLLRDKNSGWEPVRVLESKMTTARIIITSFSVLTHSQPHVNIVALRYLGKIIFGHGGNEI